MPQRLPIDSSIEFKRGITSAKRIVAIFITCALALGRKSTCV
jgi:hypothetical protein